MLRRSPSRQREGFRRNGFYGGTVYPQDRKNVLRGAGRQGTTTSYRTLPVSSTYRPLFGASHRDGFRPLLGSVILLTLLSPFWVPDCSVSTTLCEHSTQVS